MSAFLDELQHRAARLRARIVMPETGDPRTIEAALRLHRDGLATPVLVGREQAVADAIGKAGGDPGGFEVIEPGTHPWFEDAVDAMLTNRRGRDMTREEAVLATTDPLSFAALLVSLGRAAGGVAGATCPTSEVLRAGIRWIGTAPGISVVSSSFFMVVPPFRGDTPEVLTFTDAAVVPLPTADQLADIAIAAVAERRRIVGDDPRVAFLSYSTKGSAEGPEVRKVRDACETFRRRLPDVPADGEFQADAALIESVGRGKAPGSVVAGSANILVFPDLDAGNIAYKLVQRLAHAEAVGPIVQGLARPFNDLSRGASPEDIVNVACITALQST
jgi:phosphate acetyltransferase